VTVAPPEVPAETLELLALLFDLQRYGAFSTDDVRREIGTATQQLNRQRTDANRVRVAVLYTLAKSSPQDDQRALQLLDNVAKSNPGSPAVKQIALVLQAQIAERQRAVRDEQQKADAAIQKLEALRAMERSLLRDRIRSGGSGGGGSGGSGSSGGGGGGGGGGR
jgi:isochorismate hydrolase